MFEHMFEHFVKMLGSRWWSYNWRKMLLLFSWFVCPIVDSITAAPPFTNSLCPETLMGFRCKHDGQSRKLVEVLMQGASCCRDCYIPVTSHCFQIYQPTTTTCDSVKKKLQDWCLWSQRLWCQHPIFVLVQISAVPLPIQLLSDGLGKPVEDGPNVWAPAICVGDPDETPGFSLAQW